MSTSIILSAVQLWHERALGLESGQTPDDVPPPETGGPEANGSTPGQGS